MHQMCIADRVGTSCCHAVVLNEFLERRDAQGGAILAANALEFILRGEIQDAEIGQIA